MVGNLGISEWSYVFEADGRTYEVRGCDLFEFENGKIKTCRICEYGVPLRAALIAAGSHGAHP